MDGFHYYNLFETKGFEYILTIAFFLLLIPFWILLNKKAKITQKIGEAFGTLTMRALKLPKGVYHSPNHSWMYLLKSGKARIGLSDLLLKITGNITVVPLKQAGEKIRQGEPLLEIKQGEKTICLESPLSGKVIRFSNDAASELMHDPYGNGWLFELEPNNWIAETKDYFLADKASYWAEWEIVRFKDFLIASLAKHEPSLQTNALQDGGELREHIMEEMPEEIWADFGTVFLRKDNDHAI